MKLKNRNRRDHIIPQGYLRGFIHPDRKDLANKPLWTFGIKENCWSERSTSEIGWLQGFYDYSREAEVAIGLASGDTAFDLLEREFPPACRHIVENHFSGWMDHLNLLLRFMQMMRARSFLYFHQKELETRAAIIGQVAVDLDGNVSLEPILSSDISSKTIKNKTLMDMHNDIERGADWMHTYHWAIRYTDCADSPFVTTDSPVFTRGRSDNPAGAFLSRDTLLCFPLCWQACLIGSRDPFNVRTERFCSADLKRFRQEARTNAKLFVVSPVRIGGFYT